MRRLLAASLLATLFLAAQAQICKTIARRAGAISDDPTAPALRCRKRSHRQIGSSWNKILTVAACSRDCPSRGAVCDPIH